MTQFILVTLVGVFGSFAPNSFASIINQTYSGSSPANITGTLPDQGSILLEKFTLPSITIGEKYV